MSAPVVTVGAPIMCPHGGRASISVYTARVFASGAPVVAVGDPCVIAGCGFRIGMVPRPCISVRWANAAQRVRISGRPAILQTSIGLALGASQQPNGAVTVVAAQPRVRAI